MVSTFTQNIQLEEPARGDQVNGWFTPVNAIMTTLDLAWGGTTTITASSTSVVLSAAQFKSKTLIFTSTLTANITVTFPASFVKSYEILHQCSGSSAFTITLATTVAGGPVIGAPPGENVSVINNGGGLSYLALHRVGDYWDHAGSSVPGWVSVCTVPPYINCDGTAFSSVTYPQLAGLLGTTTLPDSRGRARFSLNQGTGRITAGIGGVDGNTKFAAGGSESTQLHTHAVSDPGHTHGHNLNIVFDLASGPSLVLPYVQVGAATISANVTSISINNAGAGASQNMPPAYIGGVTMIRAA